MIFTSTVSAGMNTRQLFKILKSVWSDLLPLIKCIRLRYLDRCLRPFRQQNLPFRKKVWMHWWLKLNSAARRSLPVKKHWKKPASMMRVFRCRCWKHKMRKTTLLPAKHQSMTKILYGFPVISRKQIFRNSRPQPRSINGPGPWMMWQRMIQKSLPK